MSERVALTHAAASGGVLEVARDAGVLREHVGEIARSPAFKGSRRSQQFLHYIVEKAIDGPPEDLKERRLGVELFGRVPSYDTGEDAIVRVTASDVRRRLHQFYAEGGLASEVRIDLPAGSYTPEFRWVAVTGPESVAPAVRRRRLTISRLVLCALAVAVIGASLWRWYPRPSGLDSPKNVLPWSAILQRGRQVQVVLSDPDMSTVQELLGFQISLSDYANRRYVPDSLSPGPEMRRVLRSFRGVNVASVDAGIALQVSELALACSEHVKTRNARSLQFANFKTDGDFILLGSPRSNPWSGLFEDQLDFQFVYDEGLKQEVVRNQRPQQGELPRYMPTAKGWETGQAFAIVALVGNPGQSGHVLLLAGTNAEGTEAAGKLVTNLDLLSRTLERYGIDPRGPVCRFEVLLQVRTMAGSPNTLEVIACHRLTPAN